MKPNRMPSMHVLTIGLIVSTLAVGAIAMLRPPQVIVVAGPATDITTAPEQVTTELDPAAPVPVSDDGGASIPTTTPNASPVATNPELIAAAVDSGIDVRFISALASCTSDNGRIPIMAATADELNRAYNRDLDFLIDKDAAELAALYVIGSIEQLGSDDPTKLAHAFLSGNGAASRGEEPTPKAQQGIDCVTREVASE